MTSRISPIEPASAQSRILAELLLEWPWCPICVTTWCFVDSSVSRRTSLTVWQRGFWQ